MAFQRVLGTLLGGGKEKMATDLGRGSSGGVSPRPYIAVSFLFKKVKNNKSAKSKNNAKSYILQFRCFLYAFACFPLVSDGPMVRDLCN
jgi:hypothetical protein